MPDEHGLSPRMRTVAQLVALGYTNAAIAKDLHIHVKTVEKHRHAAYRKLGVSSPVALVHKCLHLGLVQNQFAPREPLPVD